MIKSMLARPNLPESVILGSVFWLVCCLQSPAQGQENTAGPVMNPVEFNRDIRPLLADKCFSCHGPDRNMRKADLRLDTPEGLLGTGDQTGVIVPGKPAESEFFSRITTDDSEQVMPPPDSRKALSSDEITLLKRWIEQGGKFEGHWAFLPVRDTSALLPDDAEKSLSDQIDGLVEQELSRQNRQLSLEADRITLIRRLSFDLTGLPPTETEVAEFLADESHQAYETVVERLLKSPHHGERLAVWWLDLVRYADTVGYHGDQEMSVSPFRQYVIESFNSNKPFDQFTIEQLAGDLLPEPTQEQKIASGYNRLGMMSAEGGVQDKEYLAKYIAERVRNATGTWLGITLGCAECHDHKFDPLTTRDFYRFEAFFADIRERGLYSGAHADGSWGPSIKVPGAAQSAQLAELDRKIDDVKKVLGTTTPEIAAAQAEWEKSLPKWYALNPVEVTSAGGATLKLLEDQSVLASGTNPDNDTVVLNVSACPPNVTAIRVEALPDDSLPSKGPGRAGNGNFVLSELVVSVKSSDGTEQPVPLQNASATYEQTGAAEQNPYGKWAAAAAIDGDVKGRTWGWAVMEKVGQAHVAVFEMKTNLTLGEGQTLSVSLWQNLDNPRHTLGRFRISVSTSDRPVHASDSLPAQLAAIINLPADQRTEAQSSELAAWYRSVAPGLETVRAQLADLEKARMDLDAKIPTTLITEAVAPRMVRILPRGNWMDDSGEVVTPGFPASLSVQNSGNSSSVVQQSDDQRLTRLDLARWIMSPENPLTARVFVNRLWKICFGMGLSRKLDDLGAQGEWPTHPELLDLLAHRFAHNGWNIREILKAIVMSRTYRQSSVAEPDLRESDPDNRWLARQGRFRLEAEFVRDNALAVSGLLVKTIGGRSSHPYQPPGYWAYLNFPTREWQNGTGDDLYRRGLYIHWQRQYLHPALLAFDAPSREECTADRARSNTPLQSLVLLNDPSYVEAARAFAELILSEGGETVDSRLDYAFRRALSRSIDEQERSVLQSLLEAHQAEYLMDPEAARELLSVGGRPVSASMSVPELAAWTSVSRTILNLHESITRN